MKPPENNFKDSSRTLNVDTSMSDSENIYKYKTNLSKQMFYTLNNPFLCKNI